MTEAPAPSGSTAGAITACAVIVLAIAFIVYVRMNDARLQNVEDTLYKIDHPVTPMAKSRKKPEPGPHAPTAESDGA